MRAAGGRSGFTLIELLLITVLLGILAMIGTSVWGAIQERAIKSSLQSEFRTLLLAQETHHTLHGAYTDSPEALEFEPGDDVEVELSVAGQGSGPPPGIPGEGPPDGTPAQGPPGGSADDGWAARLIHTPTGVECAAFYGDAEEMEPAEEEEVVECRSD